MVKSKLVVSGALILAFTSSMAMARDDRMRFPVSDAMNAVAAKEKLGDQVKFYFGDQAHPGVAKSFGVDQSNRKTSGVGKSDQQACDWAFLSAMLAFRDKAIQNGVDAVINIRSNYKNTEFSSATEYECGVGGIMSGVTFKGEIVKLK
jgi:hypothetical protein